MRDIEQDRKVVDDFEVFGRACPSAIRMLRDYMAEGEALRGGKLRPDIWENMDDDARKAYAGRNMLLWKVLRAISPGTGGDVDEAAERGIREVEALRAEVAKFTDGPHKDVMLGLMQQNERLRAEVERLAKERDACDARRCCACHPADIEDNL